jgi:hypothetical protein
MKSLMMKLPSDEDFLDNNGNDNTFINIVVVTGKLEMAVIDPPLPEIPVKPSKPHPPWILATIEHSGRPVEVIADDNGSVELSWMGIPYHLLQGGLLTNYRRMVPTEEEVEVTKALMENPSLFGQHLIQGFNEEPRIQAHFHHEATNDFEGKPQPGYRYNHITTTVVLYRNGKDKMGQHKGKYCCYDWADISSPLRTYYYSPPLLSTKDNDQGEKVILAVVVNAPETNIRNVVIWSDDKEEKITLYLRRGDAYCMDGKMQLNYTHGVAAASKDKDKENELSTETNDSWDRRICIVFRQGKKVMYKNDSGTPCIHLNPSAFGFDTNPWYGQVRGLKEGCLYSQREIYRMGAHTSQQRGVSGNSTLGCDAIVVAGLGEVKGDDTLFELVYSASTRGGGAEGMILSRKCGYMVRVYRTNKYNHKLRALVPRSYYCGGKKKSSSA